MPQTAPDSMLPAPELLELKARYKGRYVLGAYDILDVVVQRHPDLNRSVAVQPDGYISFPIVHEVKAAGLTLAELDARLTELLSKRLVEPEVTVIPTKIREPQVYVLGRVNRPGAISMRSASTAAEALANAGDVMLSGKTASVAILRVGEDGNVRARLLSGQPSGQPGFYMALASIKLEPEDVVFVPEKLSAQTARIIEDYLTRPITGATTVLTPWVQLETIRVINKR
ncbi:MAG: polysaccharide export protein [Gammaproteobacteria bacterium]|nr:polysaccharide export protein [Gammaproteobacteria bacterium]